MARRRESARDHGRTGRSGDSRVAARGRPADARRRGGRHDSHAQCHSPSEESSVSALRPPRRSERLSECLSALDSGLQAPARSGANGADGLRQTKHDRDRATGATRHSQTLSTARQCQSRHTASDRTVRASACCLARRPRPRAGLPRAHATPDTRQRVDGHVHTCTPSPRLMPRLATGAGLGPRSRAWRLGAGPRAVGRGAGGRAKRKVQRKKDRPRGLETDRGRSKMSE